MNQSNPTNNILKLTAVRNKTGKPRSSLYSMIANGEFPKPIKLSARSVGWLESDVESWINDRIQKSRFQTEVSHDRKI